MLVDELPLIVMDCPIWQLLASAAAHQIFACP
jgi:hypothetical protein